MQALIQAIKDKYAGSTLSDDVNGRIDLDEADDVTLPRIVWFVVSGVHDLTFTEDFNDVLLQFSIFSAKTAGVAEIANIYADLKALFDECALTIAGRTLVWMREENLTTMIEDDTTTEGAPGVRHWAVDFSVKTLAD